MDLDSPDADMLLDLRQPLPFNTDSVDFIFSEHFIEHISLEEALSFLKECRRILKPSGVLRISTPSLKWLIAMYAEGRLDEWSDVDWVPTSCCKLINEGMRSWGHQFLYDEEELMSLLREAGFNRKTLVNYQESIYRDLLHLEFRPWHQELIVEAS